LAHFFPEWKPWLWGIADPRDPLRIVYPLPFLVTEGLALFLLKLGARRQIRFALRTAAMLVNLNRLAGTGVESLAHPDTLEYLLKKLPPAELDRVRVGMVRRLVRMRCLDRYRLFGQILVAIDGTGHLVFSDRHCESCLTQKQGKQTLYYHMVLEAKLVTSNGMAISVLTEFIENTDPGAEKQDCELKACYRLTERLKAAFPQLPLCLLADGLYLSEPVLKICRENRWGYIATFKEGHLPERWREYEALRELSPENRRVWEGPKGIHQEFAWVSGLEIGKERTNVLECRETPADAQTTRFVWGTNLDVKASTVVSLANRGGRLRWKIENEGFKEQKRGGYNLEHAYSRHSEAAKNYYILLQLARALDQLLEKGDLFRKVMGGTVAVVFGGVRGLAPYLRESLRYWRIPEEALQPESARSFQIRFDTS